MLKTETEWLLPTDPGWATVYSTQRGDALEPDDRKSMLRRPFGR
jgi:hypothetical protein